MADETRELAKFAANLNYEKIPAHVRALALNILVDQIGCEIGGLEMPWARQVWETYRKMGGTQEATVVGYGDRLPLMSAVFINSTFGHSLEFDDGNPVTRGKPGAELIPPLMAVAERGHASGRDFLTALIAAYEVRGHIGWAVSEEMGEHGGPQDSTSCAPFGVAAGVGKLLGLDAEGIRNALGIAGAYTGGLMQYGQGGGSVKRIYAAIAGTGGLQSALLAQAGMTGPEGILEGARGLLKIFTSAYRVERLVAELGTKWMTEYARFKPYSCCGGIHAAIDGLRKIVSANNLTADSIESIDVGYPSHNHGHISNTAPHDVLGMQFSNSYTLAITLLKGHNAPADYTLEALADPKIRAFASKISTHVDADLSKRTGKLPARVKVQTKSGDAYEEAVIDPKGSPESPLSSGDIDDKFRSLVVDVVGAQGCENMLRALRSIEALDDMAKLPPLLVFDRAAAKKCA